MDNNIKYSVMLTDKDGGMENFNGDSQVGVFVDVIETLTENYNLKENVSLPYGPGSKRAILNTTPENLDGSEMNSYHELSNGSYLNKNLNREEKIRYIIRLASECDVDVHYSGWE